MEQKYYTHARNYSLQTTQFNNLSLLFQELTGLEHVLHDDTKDCNNEGQDPHDQELSRKLITI